MSLWFSLDVKDQDENLIEVFDINITHNLRPMAREAGILNIVWNYRGHQAKEIIDILEKGLAEMIENPIKYNALNPPNGWGDYDTFIEQLEEILVNVKKYPSAKISANG